MSFLDKYLGDNKLKEISGGALTRLQDLEEKLRLESDEEGKDFDECVKLFGPRLVDIATRLGERVRGISVKSIQDALSLIQFAAHIGFEIYQVTNDVKDCVIPEGLSEAESLARQIDFSKDLAYFVWLTADPLAGKLSWIPFKKTLEEKLVRFVAGAAAKLAIDLLKKKDSSVAKASHGSTFISVL